MGADFIFNWIAIKKGSVKETKEKLYKAIDNFKIPELSDNPKQQVITSLKKKHSENFELFCEFWEEGYNGDFEEDYPEEEGEIIDEERARNCMKEVVDEVFNSVNARDFGIINFKGYEIFLSGGMSWGDEPTDSYRALTNFNYLPKKILEEAGVE